ncbi:hypothetical protein BO78DRAFT_394834 [Aspergillus sclerotiicarbonarius CBS 121057]|uniref:Uncharacterized protein n=1 Tax=Aspergillus sclerotiicarbonarius (strain CBS 121057 / IBT 28362) TaxID=1448318 RepID=A0A319EH56_ASPSB|nr:hypothetical protein BO78DRAFT_394834 [Aspergillus sclerotiicarbonarius CBS 121057]
MLIVKADTAWHRSLALFLLVSCFVFLILGQEGGEQTSPGLALFVGKMALERILYRVP